MSGGLPPLLRRIEDHGRNRPDHPAVVDAGVTLTYGELAGQVARIAAGLRWRGVGDGDLVGVLGEKSAGAVATLLGVLRAGAGYVPLDPQAPVARTVELLADARCPVALAPRAGSPVAAALRTAGPVPVWELADPAAATEPAGPLPDRIAPTQVAYCMYTSGSTGRPKGVLISHRALSAFFAAVTPLLDLGPDARCLNTSAVHFDVSVVDLLLPLVRGATVHLGPPFPSPPVLLGLIERERLTHLAAVSSTLTMLADQSDGFKGRDLSSLRRVTTGAEVLNPRTIQRWLAAAPDLVVVNGYGPTEATCFAVAHPISVREPGRTREYPIGRPLPGVRVMFRAPDGRVGDDGPGEILIAGDQVMTGYLRRPEEEARAFCQHGGIAYYRTGDHGHRRQDGVIVFVGRRDDEVKIRGYRINLNEVTRALESHGDVGHAFAAPVVDRRGMRVLACAIAPVAAPVAVSDHRAGPGDQPGGDLLAPLDAERARSVRDHAVARLPAYMVPAILCLLPAVPVLSSGKPDAAQVRHALQAAVGARP